MATPSAGASTGISTARSAQLQKVGEAALRRWGIGPVDAISATYRQLIGLEQQAAAIEIWHLGVVPGLLQTEEYAGHVIASYSELIEPMPPDRIDQLVRVRMARQEILERKGPVQITAVLDEAIVQRPTGGREVMLGQLTRLVELASRTNITIRVLPHDGPHPMLAAPFNIIHVSTRGDSGDGTQSVVTSEHLNGVRLAADKDEVILHERVFRKIADTSLDVTNSAAFIRATRALRWR
jgi:Domain of unknown function (DUF5753)